MRAQSRVFAFKIIFSALFDAPFEESIAAFQPEEKLSPKDIEFAQNIVNAFNQHKEELLRDLGTLLKNYELERLYTIDKALLLLAMTEIRHIGTPKPVAINEVLEIAKKFSTDASHKFINGVLGKFN